MAVAKVEFGRLDAENEEHLLEYFVDTGVVDRIATGERQYIIGRKGSGKTALFRRLGPERVGHTVLWLEFTDYSWEAHKALAEEGVPLESSYVASWRFTYLMSMVSHWAQEGKGAVKKKGKRIVESLYGTENPPWYQLLEPPRLLRSLRYVSPATSAGAS